MMKFRVCSVVVIAAALLICPLGIWASDEAPTAPAVTQSQSLAARCTPVSRDVLVASGAISGEIEPVVPCEMDLQGHLGFDTVAQGKWSGFGWCDEYIPDMGPCRSMYPSFWLCFLPSRPHFECVIRDECVWADFWDAHQIGPFQTPPPDIDFENYVVIAVVLGMRDNCGYEVEITSIRETDCGVQVTISECLQTNTESRMVNPYHFVKIPKACVPYSKRVCFYHGGKLPEYEGEPLPE